MFYTVAAQILRKHLNMTGILLEKRQSIRYNARAWLRLRKRNLFASLFSSSPEWA
jgi:hypothetical protein